MSLTVFNLDVNVQRGQRGIMEVIALFPKDETYSLCTIWWELFSAIMLATSRFVYTEETAEIKGCVLAYSIV